MRHRSSAAFVLCLTLAAAAVTTHVQPARAQDDPAEGEQTRGAFFATRPVANTARPGGQSKSQPSRPKPKPKPKPKPNTGGQSSSQPKPNHGEGHGAGGGTSVPPVEPGGANTFATSSRIGVGYTLFACGPDMTAAERVAPDRRFATGERILVSLETNTDGYLYIFNDDGASAQMLYPHGRLGGENRVAAHVPVQIPTAAARVCFDFTDNSRPVERLYVVIARAPLAGVPEAESLVKYCAARDGACEWEVTPEVWARVRRDARERMTASRSDELLGKSPTERERESLTRGLTLSKAEPGPSIIRMNLSPGASVLVTSIDLARR
ncbi:MAG TPA: DUF4384 domain-containing protein [Pyrinomonadaceae bacterium]|nr:DUF4384 domain-containing protein [Pyrinomonadaceae bacterium]